jgi:hypothetical protein
MLRAYQKMVAGEASDLYASDTYTWSATSSGPRAKDELVVNSHPPSGSRTRYVSYPESVISSCRWND